MKDKSETFAILTELDVQVLNSAGHQFAGLWTLDSGPTLRLRKILLLYCVALIDSPLPPALLLSLTRSLSLSVRN